MSYIICWIFNTSLILSRCFSNQLLRNIINIHCQSLVRFIDNSGGPFGPLCRLYTEFYIEICNSSQGLLTVISLSIISPPYYWKLYSGPFHSPLFLPHTFPMMSQLPITVTSFFHLRLYPTFLKQQVSIFSSNRHAQKCWDLYKMEISTTVHRCSWHLTSQPPIFLSNSVVKHGIHLITKPRY